MKKALITGIAGQDGSYLADLLLSKGYEVHGMVRRLWEPEKSFPNILHLIGNPKIYGRQLFLHQGDLSDGCSIYAIVAYIQPNEIYNLGAQTHIKESFDTPTLTIDINANGLIKIMEAARALPKPPRIYQASTSELFGESKIQPQNEDTPMNPVNPYSIGKLAAYQLAKTYRKAFGLFVSNGILFNHESPRRSPMYVTRKITQAAARIYYKQQTILELGTLDTYRDWGYAKEYVQAMWQMLQQDKPDDFVIGTGETHSVREWLEAAFAFVGLNPYEHVSIGKDFMRPTEITKTNADPTKAKKVLGFKAKIRMKKLVKLMIQADLEREKP